MATPPSTPPATKDESLSLLTLSNELSSVSGWYMLGLNLGVAPDQLDAIKTSPVMLSGDEKRTEMLNIWLKNSQGASWQEVVTALRNIREVRLAEAIEKKHPASPGGTPPFSPISSTAFNIPLTEQSQATAATNYNWDPSSSFSIEPQPKRPKLSGNMKGNEEALESIEQIEVTKMNMTKIQGSFGDLLVFVRRKLQEKLTEREIKGDFWMFLLTIFSLAKQCIPHSSDLGEIFQAITYHGLWDYRNYYPLEQIITRFGENDLEMMERMIRFKKDLSGFHFTTKIKHYIPAAAELKSQIDREEQPQAKRSQEYYMRLSVKLKQHVAEYTLDYLENLWKSLSYHLLLPPPSVLLDAVLEKSIVVVWLIPMELAVLRQVIEKGRQSAQFFQEHSILSVTIGDVCVYESAVEKETMKETGTTQEHQLRRELLALKQQIQQIQLQPNTVKYKRYWAATVAVLLFILFYIVGTFGVSKITSSKNAMTPLERLVPGRMEIAKRNTQGNILPIIATMPEFSKHKVDSTNWYSEPFYTHPGGYKLCLSVDADGYKDGEGTHVGVYLNMLHGEFDDQLEWPFQGDYTILLLNQIEDHMHYEKTIFSFKRDRVITAELSGGWGIHKFISYRELSYSRDKNSQYLRNDTLQFQVMLSAIDHSSSSNILPVQITMTDFEGRKNDSEDWWSEPFYTHPGGYNMQIRVNANGRYSSKDTYVSVYVWLLQGQYDNNLKWPFYGEITIKLLNQVEDRKHFEKTLEFNDKTHDSITSRNHWKGWGLPQFISHNFLSNNKQYAKDGSLHFYIQYTPYASSKSHA